MPSCKGGNSLVQAQATGDTLHLDYARYLTLEDHGTFTTATIRNPWDTTRTLHTYILVPDSTELPDALPDGTVVRTPLKNALVYSTVHQSLVGELGVMDAIGGICDLQYIHNPDLLQRISEGKVADCGNSNTPNIERIIQLSPDAVILSPYETSGTYGKLGQMGIPLIECADYMESNPLGRAEWMKFYGMLFGRTATATEMFNSIADEYNRLKATTDTVKSRPKVLMDRLYGNSWHVPTANSTTGAYLGDAGAVNPFADKGKAGSVGLAGEQVLHEAGDADIWLIRYAQDSDKTLRELSADHPLYGQFKAFKLKNVYGCNTDRVNYYEEMPFHPHWMLRDLIMICHPELETGADAPRYFTLLKP